MTACILCGGKKVAAYHSDRQRDYLQCKHCELIFVPPERWLSSLEERNRYDTHNNSINDAGYTDFLGKLLKPLSERLPPGSCGLDFGSGPNPVFSQLLTQAGHTVSLYDYFYANKPTVFSTQYDFITATEVIEHLQRPLFELDRLWSILKPGGHLGIMTQLSPGPDAFTTWHYKNDATHIAFYSKATLEWLRRRWSAELTLYQNDTMIFKKT